MVQEEQQQQQKCTSSGGGGGGGGSSSRSCKKPKLKKIPQRGLGVAQLEKLRIEEQQKKDASCFGLPITASQMSIPFPTASSSNLASSNSLFKLSIPITNVDLFTPGPPAPAPPPPPLAYAHTLLAGGGNSVAGPALMPLMWNALDFNPDSEGRKLDPVFAFRPSFNNESSSSNPIWRFPGFLPRRPNQPLQSSLVNVSTSPSSSSGVNLLMEPPSNQIYSSSPTTPSWPEEERMVGLKRPWPFSLDNRPGPSSLQCRTPSLPTMLPRWDEPPCGLDPFKFEPGNTISFREGNSSPSMIQANELNPVKKVKEYGVFDGGFLTLAPSATTPYHKTGQSSTIAASHYGEFDLLSFQGSMEDPFVRSNGMGQQQRPFYSFLPMGTSSRTSTSSYRKRDEADSVDLNLKL